eukprot:Pgem_evm1s8711
MLISTQAHFAVIERYSGDDAEIETDVVPQNIPSVIAHLLRVMGALGGYAYQLHLHDKTKPNTYHSDRLWLSFESAKNTDSWLKRKNTQEEECPYYKKQREQEKKLQEQKLAEQQHRRERLAEQQQRREEEQKEKEILAKQQQQEQQERDRNKQGRIAIHCDKCDTVLWSSIAPGDYIKKPASQFGFEYEIHTSTPPNLLKLKNKRGLYDQKQQVCINGCMDHLAGTYLVDRGTGNIRQYGYEFSIACGPGYAEKKKLKDNEKSAEESLNRVLGALHNENEEEFNNEMDQLFNNGISSLMKMLND